MRKQEDEGGIADGKAAQWQRHDARLRFQEPALSYIEKETVEAAKWTPDLRDLKNQ